MENIPIEEFDLVNNICVYECASEKKERVSDLVEDSNKKDNMNTIDIKHDEYLEEYVNSIVVEIQERSERNDSSDDVCVVSIGKNFSFAFCGKVIATYLKLNLILMNTCLKNLN